MTKPNELEDRVTRLERLMASVPVGGGIGLIVLFIVERLVGQ
jgi:hypothetical protein